MSGKEAKKLRQMIRDKKRYHFEAMQSAIDAQKKKVAEFKEFVSTMKLWSRLRLCWRILRKRV